MKTKKMSTFTGWKSAVALSCVAFGTVAFGPAAQEAEPVKEQEEAKRKQEAQDAEAKKKAKAEAEAKAKAKANEQAAAEKAKAQEAKKKADEAAAAAAEAAARKAKAEGDAQQDQQSGARQQGRQRGGRRQGGGERGAGGRAGGGERPAGGRAGGGRGGEGRGRFGGGRGGAPNQDAPVVEEQPAENTEGEKAEKKIADPLLSNEWMGEFDWRNIGPANMSGRIVDLAIYEKDPSTYWVATASGGLLKTTNNGTTFKHQFDGEKTISIGDVEVAPSDVNVLYVGTGESNPRNSVSWGNGVYKSTDGGESWKHLGLDETFQIGEIKVHPENPDIVYVGALGRLWGPNEQRGLFKSIDGGANWEKVFYVDDKTGVIDVDMHPSDPDTLIIATYERERDGFDTNDPAKRWGPGTGMYKTTDAGASWAKISAGLPSCEIGRIGIDYYDADPNIVYALIETEKIGEEPEDAAYFGMSGTDAEVGAKLTEIEEDSPAAAAGLKAGDIVLELGEKPILSYNELIATVRTHLAGETVGLKVSRDRKPLDLEVSFTKRPGAEEDAEGGNGNGRRRSSSRSPFSTRLGGQVPNVQDQQGPDGAEMGGIFRSDDGGDTWTRINSLNPRPMYFSEIRVDPSDNNHIFVMGISLYRSKDGGETFTGDGGGGGVHVDHHAMWVDPADGRHIILGNDGGLYETYDRMDNWTHHNRFAIGQFYHVGVGPRENYMVYGGLQDNGSWGGPSRARTGRGPRNSDWFRIGGGDGFLTLVDPNDPDQLYAESQNGGTTRMNLRTGAQSFMRARAPRGTQYRFNWKTPFLLSNHNSKVYYNAGNYVFRSMNKGDGLVAISPDISNTERGSATALTESPRDADVLYVGSDDGAVWRTRDGGSSWDRLYGTDPEPEPEPEADADAEEEAEVADAEPAAEADAPEETPDAPTEPLDDPLSGTFEGMLTGENAPPSQTGFELRLKLGKKDVILGEIDSDMGVGEIVDGKFSRKDNKLKFSIDRDGMTIGFSATLDQAKGKLTGELSFNEGQFKMPFEAQRAVGAEGDKVASVDEPEDAGEAEPEAPDPADPIANREVHSNLGELIPAPRWVSSMDASRYSDGRVYMTLDGHRSTADLPYVFASEDFGTTWRSLTANLPDDVGSAKVLREDIVNQNILYLGTEFSTWVSVDRGSTWTSMNTNLPTVAVHEIAQHPTRGEIVAGTHGRSLWIMDVTALRQMTNDNMNESLHLYRPNTAYIWRDKPSSSETIRAFQGQNPAFGTEIFYSFSRNVGKAELVIKDIRGMTIKEFAVDTSEGLHSVSWDLRADPSGRQRRGARLSPGKYLVELSVGMDRQLQTLTVSGDPEFPAVVSWGAEYDEMLEAMKNLSEEGEEFAEDEESDFH